MLHHCYDVIGKWSNWKTKNKTKKRNIEHPKRAIAGSNYVALLGAASCSLQRFTWHSLRSSVFLTVSPFQQISFLLFHSFLLPFNVLLPPDDILCSLLHFTFSSCSLLPFAIYCDPCSQITNFMLPDPFIILGHAPCSLLSQRGILSAPWLPIMTVQL